MRTVIIGNSAAAVGCIEGLRALDKQREIVVLSTEQEHVYGRPLISYLLMGKTDRARMLYRPRTFYDDMCVTLRLGVRAEAIDPVQKVVALKGGETVSYDQLLVATGSRPFIPPIQGLDTVRRWCTFTTLKDAHTLQQMIDPRSHVLIVGAGLIGLKCAEGICARVAQIDVVDQAPQVLPSALDIAGAQRVQTYLERRGLHFHLQNAVQSLTPHEATLTNGRRIPFDVLVMAAGVRPNVELVKQAGGDVERGIVVDAYSRTSLPDIFAAGDCAQGMDCISGTSKVMALWPNAYMQGESAGTYMAGGKRVNDKAIAMNAMGMLGLHICTAGELNGESDVVQDDERGYKKLVRRDGVLTGFVMIGDVERAGIYTALIRQKTLLKEIDYELVRKRPQLMAFSKEERQRQLGGAQE